MMRMAAEDSRGFDYFHLITGQDYPACDLKKADERIEEGRIYMEHKPLPRSEWECWDGGFQFYRYKTFARWTDARRPIWNKMLNRLCKIAQFYSPKQVTIRQENGAGRERQSNGHA